MPEVSQPRGAEIRSTYEDAGLTREQFAGVANVPAKAITNATCGGWLSRPRAARIAAALNKIQSRVRWTADRIFTEEGEAGEADAA